jgi:hypothetical protein
MDAIKNLLTKYGWRHVLDMAVKDQADRPVYELGLWRCVISPMWSTFYQVSNCTVDSMDSFKTDDPTKVESIIKEIIAGNNPNKGK